MNDVQYKDLKELLQEDCGKISEFDMYYFGFMSYCNKEFQLKESFDTLKCIADLLDDPLLFDQKVEAFTGPLLDKVGPMVFGAQSNQGTQRTEILDYFKKYFHVLNNMIQKLEHMSKAELFFIGRFHAMYPVDKIDQTLENFNEINKKKSEQKEEEKVERVLEILVEKASKYQDNKLYIPNQVVAQKGTLSLEKCKDIKHEADVTRNETIQKNQRLSLDNQNKTNGTLLGQDSSTQIVRQSGTQRDGPQQNQSLAHLELKVKKEFVAGNKVSHIEDNKTNEADEESNVGETDKSQEDEDVDEDEDEGEDENEDEDIDDLSHKHGNLDENSKENLANNSLEPENKFLNLDQRPVGQKEDNSQVQAQNNLQRNENDTLRKCMLCEIQLTPDLAKHFDTCQHYFHEKCIKDYLKEQIGIRRVTIKCPSCEIVVRLIDLIEFVEQPQLDEYIPLCLNSYTDSKHEVCCCPTPGCSYFFLRRENKLECPVCDKKYCLNCQADWHKNMDCLQFKERQKKSREEDISEDRLGNKFKKCRSCGIWVPRISKENIMICKCKNKFCYICGKQNPDSPCHCLNNQKISKVSEDLFHQIMKTPVYYLRELSQLKKSGRVDNRQNGNMRKEPNNLIIPKKENNNSHTKSDKDGSDFSYNEDEISSQSFE